MKTTFSKTGVYAIATLCVISIVAIGVILLRPPTSEEPSSPPLPQPQPEPAPRFIPTQPPAAFQSPASDLQSLSSSTRPQLSKAVETLTGENHKKTDYNDYRDALRELTTTLPPEDIRALTIFLTKKAADQKGMRPIAFNGIKNDVLDVLLRQETLPKGLGTMLVEMYQDKTYDDMWRDYCVQFMTAYYEIKWPTDTAVPSAVTSSNDNERETIESVYWDALKETDTTIAGTALLGLNSLSRQYSAIDRERVSQAAIDLLSDITVGEPARITAFSIAASLGNPEALPEARAIAQTGETVTLRMAAIAAIGRLGESQDVELLSALAQDSEARIRRIAETALKTARKRLEQQSATAHVPQDATIPFTHES